MITTLNEYSSISKIPHGKMIWVSLIEKVDQLSELDIAHKIESGMCGLMQDLTEREQRDVKVTGRRAHASDFQSSHNDAYFHMIEALGNLEAAIDENEGTPMGESIKSVQSSLIMCVAVLREEIYGKA